MIENRGFVDRPAGPVGYFRAEALEGSASFAMPGRCLGWQGMECFFLLSGIKKKSGRQKIQELYRLVGSR